MTLTDRHSIRHATCAGVQALNCNALPWITDSQPF